MGSPCVSRSGFNVNHGSDNQMNFNTRWLDDGDDNLLQKTSINDDKLIVITFTEVGE